ncbi:sugar transferase [Salimicrobium sp. PL1-032A]|uniref:sugar transferase n=1 Tax=Salimicrobium sp. PL1-032A TaxID=3095364 RepID=UPI00325FF7D5
MDVTIGIFVFLVSFPLLILVSILIHMNLGSPVIFRQRRIGYEGKVFTIYKFRTMKPAKKQETDQQRMTAISRAIRSLRVDELPQILNVLKGDMSFVGPRPLLPEYKNFYKKEEFERHNVLPGITGWAQIQAGNVSSWEDRFACDLWYVKNKSLKLNCRILWMTIVNRKQKLGDGSEITPLNKERE